MYFSRSYIWLVGIFAFYLALASTLPIAHAQDETREGSEAAPLLGAEWTGNFTIATDYVDRGYSQTDGKPAVQAGLEAYWDSGFYAGAWVSNVDFGDGDPAEAEIDVYLGYYGESGALSYNAIVYYYLYPGAPGNWDYDYWEVYADVEYDTGPFALTAHTYYTADNFADTGDGLYVSAGLRVPFTDLLSLDGNIGYSWVEPDYGDDYTDWNLGLKYALDAFDVDARYHDSDYIACGRFCGSRFVLSLNVAL